MASSSIRGRSAAGILSLVLVLTSCAASGQATSPSVGPPDKPKATSTTASPVHMGSGRARRGSYTAKDWVTNADYVVAVEAVSESRVGPSKREIERGEGMIGRLVELSVSEVLWSAPRAAVAAPSSFKMQVAGWTFGSDDRSIEESLAKPVRFVLEESSRIEVGHSYVMAIEWVDDVCYSDPALGSWAGLGPGDTIPYDAGELGAGEFEGIVQTRAEAQARWRKDPSNPSLRGAASLMSFEELKAVLAAAQGESRLEFPAECDLADRP